MRIAAEARVEARHLLMQHGMMCYCALELLALRMVWQLAVIEQVAGLDEVAIFGELLDRITAVKQHALFAVNEGDLGLAGGSRGEAGIVGKDPHFVVKTGYIDDIGAQCARTHGKDIVFLIVDQMSGVGSFGHRRLRSKFGIGYSIGAYAASTAYPETA